MNKIAIFFAFAALVFMGITAGAWGEPMSMPPLDNVSAPINVSSVEQIKKGALGLGQSVLYWIATVAGTLRLENNAREVKVVLGQDGAVGIGTTAPGALLDVAGKVKMQEACLGNDCRTAWLKDKCPDGQVATGISDDGKKLVCGMPNGCTPNAIQGCKVCKADGTGWVDDNSKCLSGQICYNGVCYPGNSNLCLRTPKPDLKGKLIFTTSAFFGDSDLPDEAAADRKCQEAATAAGWQGKFKALVYFANKIHSGGSYYYDLSSYRSYLKTKMPQNVPFYNAEVIEGANKCQWNLVALDAEDLFAPRRQMVVDGRTVDMYMIRNPIYFDENANKTGFGEEELYLDGSLHEDNASVEGGKVVFTLIKADAKCVSAEKVTNPASGELVAHGAFRLINYGVSNSFSAAWLTAYTNDYNRDLSHIHCGLSVTLSQCDNDYYLIGSELCDFYSVCESDGNDVLNLNYNSSSIFNRCLTGSNNYSGNIYSYRAKYERLNSKYGHKGGGLYCFEM